MSCMTLPELLTDRTLAFLFREVRLVPRPIA